MGAGGFSREIEALREQLADLHRQIGADPRRARRGLSKVGRRALGTLEKLARAEADLRDSNRELVALHRVTQLLHEEKKPLPALLRQVASAIVAGVRFPKAAAGRIRFDGAEWKTRAFAPSRAALRADFRTSDGRRGRVEIVYRAGPGGQVRPRFGPAERGFVEYATDMIACYLDRQVSQGEVHRAREDLERRVRDRTAELQRANQSLRTEIAERRRAEDERARLLARQQRYSDLLRRAGDRLEKRVQRRTAELAEANFVLQDEVAERRNAEEALRETNELLERMFSSTHVLIAYLDPEFNFVRVNQAYARADGRDPEFFIGQNHFDLYPHPENERIFSEVVRTGRPFFVHAKPFEYAEHPERGVTYWDWSLEPVRDARGKVGGLILSLLDVTERKRQQAQIEAERRRLFSVLNVLPGFVLLHGTGDRVSFANHRFLDIFGDPAGRLCHEVMRGRDTPCDDCQAAEVLRTGQPREWYLTGADGRQYHVSGYPFTDSDGGRLVLELGIDVTERRALEREILEISGEEQRRIGRDIHDLLGQNLAGISFLSKVLSQRLAAEGSSQADQAAQIATLAKQMVAQARALSRGLCPVEVSEEGLRNALRDVAAGVESVFKVPCAFECTLPALVFDSTVAMHLYHIAREAAGNAARHARPGQITIGLGDSGGDIVLSVRDDGIGLPDEGSRGQGMGLRIMKYRADIIGATLSIERAPEGGSRVVCALPGPKATGRR
ncbi:MAG: PAS domain-containing protein [Acidobacteria bacterium]|nr:PAS domain-containing protein [Acidobacteriota bacterium]